MLKKENLRTESIETKEEKGVKERTSKTAIKTKPVTAEKSFKGMMLKIALLLLLLQTPQTTTTKISPNHRNQTSNNYGVLSYKTILWDDSLHGITKQI